MGVDALVEGVVEDILEEEREDKRREEAISNTKLLPVRGSNLRVSSVRGSARSNSKTSGIRRPSPKFPARFSRPRPSSQEERSKTIAPSKSSGSVTGKDAVTRRPSEGDQDKPNVRQQQTGSRSRKIKPGDELPQVFLTQGRRR